LIPVLASRSTSSLASTLRLGRPPPKDKIGCQRSIGWSPSTEPATSLLDAECPTGPTTPANPAAPKPLGTRAKVPKAQASRSARCPSARDRVCSTCSGLFTGSGRPLFIELMAPGRTRTGSLLFSSRRRPSVGTIGIGRSGMIGGFMRAIGLGSSSSSSSQRYRTRMTLYRVAAVLALRRRSMSAKSPRGRPGSPPPAAYRGPPETPLPAERSPGSCRRSALSGSALGGAARRSGAVSGRQRGPWRRTSTVRSSPSVMRPVPPTPDTMMTSVAAGHQGEVEVRGFEPLTSSVRVSGGSPPCRPAFPQVDPDRQGRS
jgi:hypothetical protein